MTVGYFGQGFEIVVTKEFDFKSGAGYSIPMSDNQFDKLVASREAWRKKPVAHTFIKNK